MKKVRKAVIPAAGLGTRFLPATKVIPKELLPIVDRPTLQLIFEELAGAGVEKFILVISPGKESILDHFKPRKDLEEFLTQKRKESLLKLIQESNYVEKIKIVYQNQPRGLGHAVLCAKEAVGKEPFFVALGDDLIDADPSCAKQMITQFNEFQNSMVAVQEVKSEDVNKYGIIDPLHSEKDPNFYLDSDKRVIPLKDLVEKPSADEAPSSFAIVGRYLLTPAIFPILAQTKEGAGGEIQLTDGLKSLNQKEKLLAFRFKGKRFDAGDKFGYIQANIHYGLKNSEVKENLFRYLMQLKEQR